MVKDKELVEAKLKEVKAIMESGDPLGGFNALKSIYDSVEEGEEKIDLLTALTEAAKVLGMPLDALKYAEKELELTKKYFPNDTKKELDALTKVANVYQMLQEYDKALKIFEEVYYKSKEIYRETDAAAISCWEDYTDALSLFPREKEKFKELKKDGIHIIKQLLEEFKAAPNKDEETFDNILEQIDTIKDYFWDREFEKEICKIDVEILSIAREVYPKNSMKLIKLMEDVAMGLYNNKGFLLIKEAFQIARSNAKTDMDMLETINRYTFNCRFMGKEKEFKKLDKQASNLLRKVMDSFSNDKDAPYEERLRSLKEQLDFYNKVGSLDEELEILEEIAALTEEKDLKEYLATLEQMAEIQSKGNNIESLSLWQKIWDIRRNDASLREGLIDVFMEWIDDCRKFEKYEKALSIAQNALKELSSAKINDARLIRQSLAKCYSDLGRYDEALAIRELITKMNAKHYGDNSTTTLEAKSMEAYPLISLNRYDEGVKVAKEVYEKYNELLGEFNIITIERYLIFIKLSCRAGKTDDALNNAEALVKKLIEYKPYAESDDFLQIKTDAENMLDACLLLYHTEKSASDWELALRNETLELIDDNCLDEMPKVKEDFLIRLWKEASGKRFKPSSKNPAPWSAEVSKTNKFFCAAENKIYRVDNDKTYLFEDGWKEAKTPNEYKKISEADALERVWKQKGDVKKFFR